MIQAPNPPHLLNALKMQNTKKKLDLLANLILLQFLKCLKKTFST